jgi:hypothetical protein
MVTSDEIRTAPPAVVTPPDERAARRTLREQISRLEREHAAIVASACPRLAPGPAASSLAGPRLLSLGELERVRDALAARTGDLQAAAAAQQARQADARRELEQMLADPPGHRWEKLTNADLGLPGCGAYHVRPRAGIVGMLMGWWQVKISSGCP